MYTIFLTDWRNKQPEIRFRSSLRILSQGSVTPARRPEYFLVLPDETPESEWLDRTRAETRVSMQKFHIKDYLARSTMQPRVNGSNIRMAHCYIAQRM